MDTPPLYSFPPGKGEGGGKADALETKNHRPHRAMGLPGILRFLLAFAGEILRNLPALLALRERYRKVRSAPPVEPTVAWVGDNLDEVNGIALSSRIMLRELRALGKPVYLFGVAFHDKPPRSEGPDNSVILSPGAFSLDQAGYAESEVALPSLRHFVAFLGRHPVDVMEFQTPGTVSSLCLLAARIVGIKTLSHYRTDIITYSKLLVDNRLGVWLINTVTTLFTRVAGPVVVPSYAYRDKVMEMGVPLGRIHRLPRGVDLQNFHPGKAAGAAWADLGLPSNGVRLLYVGRVSMEKNLELLASALPRLLDARPDLSMTVVGDGPYRLALEARLAGLPRVHFTGVLRGETLSQVFASADIFVFPSLTDTFGNSVVEALASGIPCVTSDQGGPREIIEEGDCGEVFRHDVPGDFEAKILSLARDPARLLALKANARRRALQFSYDNSARAFWDFYLRYHQNRL